MSFRQLPWSMGGGLKKINSYVNGYRQEHCLEHVLTTAKKKALEDVGYSFMAASREE